MNPVRASLRYPQVTLALTIMLVASGVYALLRMPRREDPKIQVRIGIVAAFYPGASAAEVVEAGKAKVEGLGKLIAAHVIARPSEAVLGLLPKG